ncbi:MAG: hypothetical protein ACYC6Q_08170, partial [Syntrophales bacterium]
TWNGTGLSHVSDFSSGLFFQARHYTGSYSYADDGYYSYNYYTDNHYGHVSYRRPDPAIASYDINYNQDGSWTRTNYSYVAASGYTYTGTETGIWTVAAGLSFIETAEDANYASVSENSYPYLYTDGNLTALLGGTDTLWTATKTAPAKLTLLGTYSSASIRPHIWGGGYNYGYSDAYSYGAAYGGYGNIASRNYMNDSSVTYDGGSYMGYLAGTEIDRAMDARLVALYIDPSGNAGYLKGALAGNAYPEVGMFAMDGSAYPTQMTSDLGIAPGDMISYLTESSYYSSYGIGVAGMFDAGGKIVSENDYSYGNGIQTMSFVNHEMNRAEPWGIYGLGMSGVYEAPAVAGTSWTAKVGGPGDFGARNAANYYYGHYSYPVDGYYTYNYYTDNRSGSVAYMRPDPAIASYEITYNSDGSYTKIFYSYGEVPLTGGIDYYPTGEVVVGTGLPAASIRTAEDPVNAILVSEGKYSVYNPDEGYWLADITDGKAEGNKLTGAVSGRFITRTKMGNASVTVGALSGTGIAGDLLGTYNTADSTWQAFSLGSWSGMPLAFGGENDYNNSFWEYQYSGTASDSRTPAGSLVNQQGLLQGLIGGTETLFGTFDGSLGNYPAVALAGLGILQGSSPLFLARFDGKNLTDPAVSNKYTLFFDGIASSTSLDGSMQGLYWKKNPADGKYEIGVLSAGSGVTANLFPLTDDPMWEFAPGTTLQAYSISDGLILEADPAIAYSSLGASDPASIAEITAGMAGGSWKTWNRSYNRMAFNDDANHTVLTVMEQATGGGYNAGVPPEAGARISEVYGDGTSYRLMEITKVDQDSRVFDANAANARIAWGEGSGFTQVSGGALKGSFDPVTATWRAVSMTTGMETAGFLNKISSMDDAQRQAFYDATKIPAFTVGTTDLRGQAGEIDLGSAGRGILNVKFLAPSTGGSPQLWASGNVNGGYTATPGVGTGSTTVSLAGYQVGTGTPNGITANFNMQNWGATKWGASVTNGSVPAGTSGFNYPNAPSTGINFQGGAAGTINAANGAFSGTAAGVVK